MSTMTRFQTDDLPFAAFLCATRRLRFLNCESVNGNGRVAFLFDDPNSEGERLHVEFESGAECSAVAFYDAVRHLRRVMDRTTKSSEHGATNREHQH